MQELTEGIQIEAVQKEDPTLILTTLPKSWNRKNIEIEFGVTE